MIKFNSGGKFYDNITIGYVGLYSPLNRKTLSGTPYKMCEALKNKGYSIKWLPVRPSSNYRMFAWIVRQYNRLFKHHMVQSENTKIGAKLLSLSIKNNSDLNQCDIVFVPINCEYIFQLDIDKPIVYLADGTFNLLVGYYWNDLSKWMINQGNQVMNVGLHRANKIIVSSDWCKKSMVNDYQVSSDKVQVVEFGANIDDKDVVKKEFSFDGHLHMLFLGIDWERKGGNIAVEATKWLNENGIKATLHIIGIRNLDYSIAQLPYIDNVGFCDKNDEEQYHKLVNVVKMCHCLLLPTLAECSAIAFSESSANGLPIFSHRTGGIGNYVYDGRNGYLLPLGSSGADFGKKIKECLMKGELEEMSKTAYDVYKEKLNWNVWGEKVSNIIKSIL